MAIHQVALIFDDRLRPDTTGVHVRKALAGLVQVVHFQPERVDRIPGVGFDLYLSIDDDTEHRLPGHLRPRAYWAIDTHRDFAARLARSRSCDLVFAAQRDGAERLRAAGIDTATWLPLACDPEIHRPHAVSRQYDVAFVGNVGPGPRGELLERIRRQFPDHFIGRAYFDDMARIYSASRIVFNRSLANDVNMRVFEATACGSLLVTNDLAENGQEELFRDGMHLVTYREPGELLERIRYYLGHVEERDAIAAAGRAEALARHTYRQRMELLLAVAEDRLARTVVGGVRPLREDVGAKADGLEAGDLATFGQAGGGFGKPAPGAPCGDQGPEPGAPKARRRLPGRAGSRVEPVRGLASIIVPCGNRREFIRECIRSLFRHSGRDWELIVVDNASTDGTAEYLAGLQDGGRVPVTIIRNARNLGDPAAIHQGLQVARGEYLVLLHDDVVVTTGWLDSLIALTAVCVDSGADGADADAESRPPLAPPSQAGERPVDRRSRPGLKIGLVGPMSNEAPPPQLVEGVPYRDLDEMHAFAQRWREGHRARWFTAPRLSGFCLMVTREACEGIGGLDERCGPGLFDDALALRARRAGFELAVAHDLFIHHLGRRTSADRGIDTSARRERNPASHGGSVRTPDCGIRPRTSM